MKVDKEEGFAHFSINLTQKLPCLTSMEQKYIHRTKFRNSSKCRSGFNIWFDVNSTLDCEKTIYSIKVLNTHSYLFAIDKIRYFTLKSKRNVGWFSDLNVNDKTVKILE